MPYSEEFISSRILWRLYWVVVNDERVEFDHFLVVLQEGDGQLTRNIRRKGCNRGEENSFPHLARIPPGAGVLLRTVEKRRILTAVKDWSQVAYRAMRLLGFHPAALPKDAGSFVEGL